MFPVSTVTNFEAAYTATSGGQIADFSGASLLTGSCTTPHIASYSAPNSGILQFPWIGCSNQDPACCPFDPASAGPISVCPQDYFTTSWACCPLGWSIYTSDIAGQTPCYTTPSIPIAAPSSSVPSNSPTPSIISTQLFTLRYDLGSPETSLSNGAKAGIIVGSIFGALLLALAIVVLVRRWQRHRQAIRDATMPRSFFDPQDYASQKSPPMSPQTAFSRARTISSPQTVTGSVIPELPSPPPPTSAVSPNGQNWPTGALPPPAISSTPPPPAMELPGSTFIHEHHPAFASSSPERIASPVPGITITSGEEIYRPPFASVERLPSPGVAR